jgi:hypothetical protein
VHLTFHGTGLDPTAARAPARGAFRCLLGLLNLFVQLGIFLCLGLRIQAELRTALAAELLEQELKLSRIHLF